MPQDAGGNRQRRAARGLVRPVDQHPLRRGCMLRQDQDFLRPVLQQPLRIRRHVAVRGDDGRPLQRRGWHRGSPWRLPNMGSTYLRIRVFIREREVHQQWIAGEPLRRGAVRCADREAGERCRQDMCARRTPTLTLWPGTIANARCSNCARVTSRSAAPSPLACARIGASGASSRRMRARSSAPVKTTSSTTPRAR